MVEKVRDASGPELAEYRGHDVFVSYSRADREAVVSLTAGLASRGKRAWVDLEDIPPSAEWMAEIRSAIESADGYLVVISPDLARSKVCAEEFEHARSAGKRIVPVQVRPTDPASVPRSLAALNWVDATVGPLDDAVDKVVQALDTDLADVRAHTRLLVRAAEWNARHRPRSLLLRGEDLKDAEALLVSAQGRELAPTPAQAQYVQVSRQAASRRQRSVVAIALCVALVAGSLGLVAWQQRNVAVEQRAEAQAQAQRALARGLDSQALYLMRDDLEVAALLALEADHIAPSDESRSVLLSFVGRFGRLERSFSGGPVGSVAFSPDDSTIAAGDLADGTLRLLDSETGRLQDSAQVADSGLVSVAFSSDAGLLATGGRNGTVRVWDASDLSAVPRSMHVGSGPVSSLAFDAAGKHLFVFADEGVRKLNAPTGSPIGNLLPAKATSGLAEVATAPSGSLVAFTNRNTVELWNARMDKALGTFRVGVRSDLATSVAFSPDSSGIAVGTISTGVQMIDVGSGHISQLGPDLSALVQSVRFAPNGEQLAVALNDGSLFMLDSRDGSVVDQIQAGGSLRALAYDSDSARIVTGGTDDLLHIWDAGDALNHPIRPAGWWLLSALTPNNGVASSMWGGSVEVQDVTTGDVTASAQVRKNVWAIAAAGDQVAIGHGSGAIDIWRPAAGGDAKPFSNLDAGLWTLAFDSGGQRLAAGGSRGMIRVWDPKSGELLATLDAGDSPVQAMTFAPDGSLVTSGEGGTISTWNLEDGTRRRLELGKDVNVSSLAVSPDGSLLAVGTGNGWIRVLERDSGKATGPDMAVSDAEFWSVAFSPDGKTLASGDASGDVFLWDLQSHKLLGPPLHTDGTQILSLSFTPEGFALVSSGAKGSMRVWDSILWQRSAPALHDYLCTRVGRNLAPDEWERYLPDDPYRETCADFMAA